MKVDKILIFTVFEKINVKQLIEENTNLNNIIKHANKYLEETNSNARLAANNYKLLKKIIKDNYGYEMLKGRNKNSNWKPTNNLQPSSETIVINTQKACTPTKKESKEIIIPLDSTGNPNDIILNYLKTIIKISNDIHSDINSFKSLPKNINGSNSSNKELIQTLLSSYDNDLMTIRKVIIPKNLDDELSKIVYDRFEISKSDTDYYSKILLLLVMILSKP